MINTGDRPIQVGSHFHFFEVNRALSFDRRQAFGKRFNIPAGTAVRFEPGDDKRSSWCVSGGAATVRGLNASDQRRDGCFSGRSAVERADARGFANVKSMSLKIPRRQYADLYGPTTGDRVRLADTESVHRDRARPHRLPATKQNSAAAK